MSKGGLPPLSVLAVGLLLSGCGPYVQGINYRPEPAAVSFDHPDTPTDPDAQALVRVVGVLRSAPKHPEQRAFEIALRLENLSKQKPLVFDPESTRLTGANLTPLQGPLSSAGPVTLEPGESLTTQLMYLIDKGARARGGSLSGVNFRLSLKLGERTVTRSVSLHLYDPDYDRGPRYGIFIGASNVGVHRGFYWYDH